MAFVGVRLYLSGLTISPGYAHAVLMQSGVVIPDKNLLSQPLFNFAFGLYRHGQIFLVLIAIFIL